MCANLVFAFLFFVLFPPPSFLLYPFPLPFLQVPGLRVYQRQLHLVVGWPSQSLHRELAARCHPGHPLPVPDWLPGLHFLLTGEFPTRCSDCKKKTVDVDTGWTQRWNDFGFFFLTEKNIYFHSTFMPHSLKTITAAFWHFITLQGVDRLVHSR